MNTHVRCSYEDAKPQEVCPYWSSTENNANNAWNCRFSDGNSNNNNNNKNNGYTVRPVAYSGFQFSFSRLPRGFEIDTKFIPFFHSVVDAFRNCMKGKMTSPQAIEYLQIMEYDLPLLAYELWSGSYKPSTATAFVVKYPKYREVFAAAFRDRIVHHWIALRLNPLFEQRFVSQGDVSFNCRKGYGTDKCVTQCEEGLRRISDNYHNDAYLFRGDLEGFFMSIDKNILWRLLERFILRWRKRSESIGFGGLAMPEMYWDILMRATEKTVMHHPERDCYINSPKELWSHLAPNKSLFCCPNDKGEPIGNLTTQLFANFLMSYFDTYVQYLFRGKTYVYYRFVDDFVVACTDKDFLLAMIPKMEGFLRDKLKLTLHKDKRYIQPVSHGLLFVGTFIKPGRTYLSNRTLARFAERCNGFKSLLEREEVNILDLQRIECVINSYMGFSKGRKTYGRRKQFINSMGSAFWKYFTVGGHYQNIKIKRKHRYKTIAL